MALVLSLGSPCSGFAVAFHRWMNCRGEDLDYMTKGKRHAIICSVAEQHKDAVEAVRRDFNQMKQTGDGFVESSASRKERNRQK